MACGCSCSKSSISKKQIVATTGLFLILFLVGHLAGNLFIFGGPAALNGYAKKLAGLRPALYILESGLFLIFLAHVLFTVQVVIENRRARGTRYNQFDSKAPRSLATRLMPISGIIIFAFLIIHLMDFTFTDHHGIRSMVNGESLGLYGVVYNSFKDIPHVLLYIAAMCSIGLHLTHGIQSFAQTYGFTHHRYTPLIRKLSVALGIFFAVAYSSIPLAVLTGLI